MNPLAVSFCANLSSTIPSTILSGTRSPRSMIGSARRPASVFRVTASRSMSPVERCGTPSCLAMRLAWVPFPAPGGPKKINARLSAILTAERLSLIATATDSAFAHETVVIPHHQLRFELLNCIHSYAHDDQQRRATEIKLHVQAVQHETPHVPVEPVTHQPQMLQVNAGNHPFGQQ